MENWRDVVSESPAIGRLVDANAREIFVDRSRSDLPDNGKIVELLRHCYNYAVDSSDDRSNQNAALLLANNEVVTVQANRLPRGVKYTEARINERPTKYAFIEHAERGVIYQAAKNGVSLEGLTMVCPWFACPDCARGIVLSGIKRVIGHKQRMEMTDLGRETVVDTVTNRWSASVSDGDTILDEAGIERIYYDGIVGGAPLLVNGFSITSL